MRGTSNLLQGGFFSYRVFDCDCSFFVTSAMTTTLHPKDDIVPCPNKSFIQRKVEPIFGQKKIRAGRILSSQHFWNFIVFLFFLLKLLNIIPIDQNRNMHII